MVKQWYYQNVEYAVVKNQDLVKIKNQEAKRLLSNLGFRMPLSKVPILGNFLFWVEFHWSAVSLSCINTEWNSKQDFIRKR